MGPLTSLAETRNLWLAFGATILITLSFPVVGSIWAMSFIDPISDPGAVRDAIAALSAEQRVVHVWVTATLDVAYPLAYGALFIGAAYRFYPTFGRFLGWAFIGLVAVDLLEGIVQVLALTDTADLVAGKAFLTPMKRALFLIGVVTTLLGWVIWIIRRRQGDAPPAN